MKKHVFVKTPTRTPGGKSKALNRLIPYIPSYDTYVEPFVGGGSMFLRLAQLYPDKIYKISDLDYFVYAFWITLYEKPMEMIDFLLEKKRLYSNCDDARSLYDWCKENIDYVIKNENTFDTACLWYILNKLSFSGLTFQGSYARLAWINNFTERCINNLAKVSAVMHSVKEIKITNLDYNELLKIPGENVFVFLDPPYKIPHNLYGKDGDIHRGFDHEKFAADIKNCTHMDWMITYNQNDEIEKWFSDSKYTKVPWDLTYTMKAAIRSDEEKAEVNDTMPRQTNKKGKRGKELLIMNYQLNNSDSYFV